MTFAMTAAGRYGRVETCAETDRRAPTRVAAVGREETIDGREHAVVEAPGAIASDTALNAPPSPGGPFDRVARRPEHTHVRRPASDRARHVDIFRGQRGADDR